MKAAPASQRIDEAPFDDIFLAPSPGAFDRHPSYQPDCASVNVCKTFGRLSWWGRAREWRMNKDAHRWPEAGRTGGAGELANVSPAFNERQNGALPAQRPRLDPADNRREPSV